MIKPAVKVSHDKGRPKGGLFIAVPDNIKNEVKDVSPSFWRTQAMILTVKSSRILLINSYFPTDPGTVVFDESDLLETLQSKDKSLMKMILIRFTGWGTLMLILLGRQAMRSV